MSRLLELFQLALLAVAEGYSSSLSPRFPGFFTSRLLGRRAFIGLGHFNATRRSLCFFLPLLPTLFVLHSVSHGVLDELC